MSDDWKPGDLALCVTEEHFAVSGCVYVVDFAFYDEGGSDTDAGIGLAFLDLPTPVGFDGYDAWRFRKVTPGHKIEGFEEPRRLPVKEKADA